MDPLSQSFKVFVLLPHESCRNATLQSVGNKRRNKARPSLKKGEPEERTADESVDVRNKHNETRNPGEKQIRKSEMIAAGRRLV